MKKIFIFLLFALFLGTMTAFSQKVDPKAYYTDSDGNDQVTDNISEGQAPLKVIFRANPEEMDGYTPSYEWHFRRAPKDGTSEELFVRYEEDTEYTFTESGTFNVILKTRLEQDGEELDSAVVTVTILESRLKFPNAFSPNNDGTNDKYGAYGVNDPNSPDHWRSIVKFHAIIINRRGQKLYEWYDPAGFWDGNYNGHPVKEGVYYVVVSAEGAEGHKYNIRKDINLLRTHSDEEGSTQ